MKDINEIIELCDRAIDEGDVSTEELIELLELTRAMLEPISNFIDETGYDCEDYPLEFFSRHKKAASCALEAYAEVLEIVGDF